MSVMRLPKHIRELEAEYGLERFRVAQEWFAKRGVSVAYVPRRGWRFYCIGRSDGPTCVICWVSLPVLVDMLAEPDVTLAAIHEKGGNTALRS